MKYKKTTSIILSLTIAMSLTGCGSALKSEMIKAMDSEQEIQLSVEGNPQETEHVPMEWTELDQLKTFKNIRRTWDDKMQIVTFDMGSKNGVLFVDLDGNWAGNNVLYNVFQNKTFVKDYWSDSSLKGMLAQEAMNQFSDISNESTGLIASVNAYFNILPANVDGTSGLMNLLSRAEAMSAIYRGDTPVKYGEVSSEYEKTLGSNECNQFTFDINNNSYLKYENGGLNYSTYNGAMTRAEAVYILMNRYFAEELAGVSGNGDFSDCVNAGDVASKQGFKDKHAWESYELEYCLQNPDKGAPQSLYNSLVLAQSLGVIGSETRWNQAISGGELLNMMIKTYEAVQNKTGFIVNAKIGANAGQSLYVKDTPQETVVSEESVGTIQIDEVRDVTNLDDLLATYGDELDMTEEELAEAYLVAENFTFEPCDVWKQVDYCYFLNVRTGPSTDFRILRSVEKGTKAHVVARCVETGWYRVLTEGKLVYQCGVYFSDFEGSETYGLTEEEIAEREKKLQDAMKQAAEKVNNESKASENEQDNENEESEDEESSDKNDNNSEEEFEDNSESEDESENSNEQDDNNEKSSDNKEVENVTGPTVVEKKDSEK